MTRDEYIQQKIAEARAQAIREYDTTGTMEACDDLKSYLRQEAWKIPGYSKSDGYEALWRLIIGASVTYKPREAKVNKRGAISVWESGELKKLATKITDMLIEHREQAKAHMKGMEE